MDNFIRKDIHNPKLKFWGVTAYVELMVGEMEACTYVTYIAKSNIGSMKMTYYTN